MKELSKVFKNTTLLVTETESGLYFDISGVAKKYGKNITDWRNSKRTLETIEVLEKSNTLEYIKVDKLAGKQTSTFIHEDLLVNFARFINVEFEVWCDKTIKNILFGNCKVLKQQLEISQKQNKELSVKRMKTYKDGFVSLSKYLKDNDIPLKQETAFDMLSKVGAVEKRDIFCSKSFLLDDTFGRQNGDSVIEFNSRALDSIFSEYITTVPTLFNP